METKNRGKERCRESLDWKTGWWWGESQQVDWYRTADTSSWIFFCLVFFACGVVCRENEEEEEEEKKPARLPERMFMEALFDYEAQQQQELSIQAGEKLKARRNQYLFEQEKNMQARQVWWLCKKRTLCLSVGF